MNEMKKTLLLAEDKFMHEMHLTQPKLTYEACGTFTKIRKQYKKCKGKRHSRLTYQNKQYTNKFTQKKGTGINFDAVSENKKLAEELYEVILKKIWKT